MLKGYKYWQGTGYLELLHKWDEENRTKADAEAAKKGNDEEEGVEPLLPGEDKTFDQRAAEVNDQIERELNSAITTTSALPEGSKPGQSSRAQAISAQPGADRPTGVPQQPRISDASASNFI